MTRSPDLQAQMDAEVLPEAVIRAAEHTLQTARANRAPISRPGPLFTNPWAPVPPFDPDASYIGIVAIHDVPARGWRVNVVTSERSRTESEIFTFNVLQRPAP